MGGPVRVMRDTRETVTEIGGGREGVPFRHRLGTRLTLSMAFMSVMLLASGGLGLRYVDIIAATLHRTSEVTAPLLSDVLEITHAGRRVRASVRTAAEQCQGVDAAEAELRTFEAAAERITRSLADRAAIVGASRDLERIAAAERRFNNIASAVLAACRRDAALLNQVDIAGDGVVADLTRANRLVAALEGRATGALRDSDGHAIDPKGAMRLLPGLTALSRLRGDVAEFSGFGTWSDYVGALSTRVALDDFERRRRERLARLDEAIRDLAPVMKEIGLGSENSELDTLQDDIEVLVVGPSGMIALQRARVALRDEQMALRHELGTIDDDYFRAVRALEATARRLDESARQEVVTSTGEAYAVVAGTSLILFLVVLGVAGDMGRRIAVPLDRVTRHVAQVHGHDDLERPLPGGLLNRDDEFGVLARAFARLASELGSARRRLEEDSRTQISRQYDRLQTAIATMPQGFYLVDADERLVVWNDAFMTMYDFRPGELVVGAPLLPLMQRCKARGACARDMEVPLYRVAVAEGRSRQEMFEYLDGRIIVITASPTADGGAAVTHEDITARRRAEEEIEHLSRFDATTGLPNRSEFSARLAAALIERAPDRRVALLHVDIDHFKTVNDAFGHDVGDRLLVMVADRIVDCVAEEAIVGRLGGDEFAVLRTGLTDPREVGDLARRIDETIARPYEIDGNRIVVRANIGIAVAPEDGAEVDALLSHADLALGRAKTEGRGSACFYESGMDACLRERRALESDLASAIERNEFELHYQPLVGAASGRIEGFEALLRWQHPERGLIPPIDFVELAEETGQIGEIGAWALREATRVAATWPSRLRVAVNISPIQFRRRALTLDVLGALGRSGLRSDRLELEITEGVLLDDTDATLATLAQLREIGVRIAMDDFGTGYSSLGYLRRFAFDKVKIDKSFVQDIGDSADSTAIVRAVTSLCSSLGITTVAEGVETVLQCERLRREGCDQFQGWLFGRPVRESEVPALLAAEAVVQPAKTVARGGAAH